MVWIWSFRKESKEETQYDFIIELVNQSGKIGEKHSLSGTKYVDPAGVLSAGDKNAEVKCGRETNSAP